METAANGNAETARTLRIATILLAVIAVVGAILRTLQYVKRGSLWLDEAMLAISIVSRPARALIFSPLEFNQTAPPLYLQLAKLSTGVFGPTEMALRLPAFLSSLLALVFFALIARRVLSAATSVIALTFFAIAPFLVIYAAEVKPYSGDAFAATVLLYIALRLHASGFSRNWVIVAGLAGSTLVWLSDTSIIVVGGLGLGLLYLAFHERDRHALKMAAWLAPVWILAALGAALGTRRRLAVFTGNMLHKLWGSSFVPAPTTLSGALFIPRVMVHFFNESLGIRALAYLCLLVAIIGAVSLWKRPNRAAFALTLAPIIVSLIAAAAKMYPFSAGRVSLYLAPSFILLLSAGIERIGAMSKRGSIPVQAALFVFFADPPSFVTHLQTPGWLTEQIEPVLSTVAANRRPGDKIYVYWGATPATTFYGPRHGIAPGSWVPGNLKGNDWHNYIPDFDRFFGEPRVWVIFSHSKVPGQREGIMSYLDSVGVRQRSSAYPATDPPDQDASVALYDLSKATKNLAPQ